MKRKRFVLFLVACLVFFFGTALWWKGQWGRRPTERTIRLDQVRKTAALPISSEALIAKALAAKEIDYETSLLYRAFALFGDDRLPKKYASETVNLDAGTYLFSEIAQNTGRLSAATLDTLAPFMARPNDPKSILYLRRSVSAGFPLIPAVHAAGNWTSLPVVGGAVRVWTSSDFPVAYDLTTYASQVELVWPKLRELIRPPTPDKAGDPSADINPDSAIDIYMLPESQIDPRSKPCQQNPQKANCALSDMGFTSTAPPFIGSYSCSAYLVIDGSLQGDELLSTLAHELFHASQFSYTIQQPWLAESTATWGEFRVMQNLDRSTQYAHMYLDSFFAGLDKTPLDLVELKPGTNQYGAYLYFLFAQMETNDAVVSDVWAYATSLKGAKAVDAVFPFKDHFRDFALRNWNAPPVPILYKLADSDFPGYSPPITDYVVLSSSDQTKTLDETIDRLTARYYMVEVPDRVAKLQVRLGDIIQKPSTGVDAIVNIDQKPQEVRHWSNESELNFCRDDPDQRIKSFLLIISNASLDDDLDGKVELEPFSEPCKDTVAKLNLNATYSAEVKTWGGQSNCEDRITLTYGGNARYKLLPVGYGTSNVHPENLSSHPTVNLDSERTGGFSINFQGGGKCTSTNKGGGTMTWTYGVDSSQVSPKGFPPVAIRLRAGEYDVGDAVSTGSLTVQGEMSAPGGVRIPWNHPGPAYEVLAFLMQQSIAKVGGATHGKFKPFSKNFTSSNSVTNSMDWPPTAADAKGIGTMNLSYSLTVDRE